MAAPSDKAESPSIVLGRLAQAALDVVRKASKQRRNLAGDNFYGNKLAQLRADATNAFGEMSASSAGDTSASAELIDASFSSTTGKKDRVNAIRELSYSLKTKWK